jgi:hypothetical protein
MTGAIAVRAGFWVAVALSLLATPALGQVSPNGPPPPGAAGRGLARLNGADGVVFEAVDDGGARHKLTGFVCPAELEGFTRTRMIVFDQSEGGRDVACNYQRDGARLTLYLTRLPGRTAEDVFDTYVLQAQNVAPDVGVAESPLPAGLAPRPEFGQFWLSRGGEVNGLWLSQIGDWHIKLRATYPEGEDAVVGKAAEAFYRQVHDQVAAPGI